MEWVLPLRHEALTPIFLALTAMGDTLFYLIALSIAYWLGDRPSFRRVTVLVAVTAMLNSWLKLFFAIPRPSEIPWLAEAEGQSFPSGHAQTAAATWIWLACEFRRRWLTILAAVLIAGIAASRVYLGVHTPTDIAAGIAIGALTVAVAWRWAHNPPPAWQKLPPAARFAVWTAAVALFFLTCPGPPDHIAVVGAGALLGFQLGTWLENDRGQPIYAGWKKKTAAVALGLGVALAIRIAGKILLAQTPLPTEAADFLRYFLIALWVVWLAPRSFRLLRLARA
jgi:membrane-associated phospholipid phosphatase